MFRTFHTKIKNQRPDAKQLDDAQRRAQVRGAISSSAPPVGTILAYIGDVLPDDGKYVFAHGETVSIHEYPELFALIGIKFNLGFETAEEFTLPDKRGRTGIGVGAGPGLTARTLGETLGSETHALTTAQLPPHVHSIKVTRQTNTSTSGGGTRDTVESDGNTFSSTESAGGTAGVVQAHNNMQPSFAENYIIRARP